MDAHYDETIHKDVRCLIDILTPLVNSYRLLVGSADELNKISLVKKHELEEAIDRANKLGDIIDYVNDELKSAIKLLLKDMDCNIKNQVYSMNNIINKEGFTSYKEFIEKLEGGEDENNED